MRFSLNLNKSISYLSLCLSLNSFCDETSRTWALLGLEARYHGFWLGSSPKLGFDWVRVPAHRFKSPIWGKWFQLGYFFSYEMNKICTPLQGRWKSHRAAEGWGIIDPNPNSIPVLWPLLSFPNLLAYWVQHFHSIIFQDLKQLNWNSITSTSFVCSGAL